MAGRGEHSEIMSFVGRSVDSELSGNMIDICPVGALTSRSYAYISRPWELRKTDSIDVLDALGSNIRVDSRGPEVLRILPRINDAVNEEWLGDRSRFAIDGLKRRRLDRPWVRKDGRLAPATWPEAFAAIARRISGVPGNRIGAVAGDLADAEAVMALKDLMAALGSANLDCRQDGAAIDASRREFYLFNSTVAGIEEADALLILGSNPRVEAPVLNARIRKRATAAKPFAAGYIGPRDVNLTYPAEHLGDGPAALRTLLDGSHAFAETLRKAERPMLILGRGAVARADGAAVLAAAWRLAAETGMLTPDWNGFNMLHLFGGQVGALDLGFVPGEGGKDLAAMLAGGVDALWLLGADGFDPARIAPSTFVIYQGHHGDRAASRADVILPGVAYTEKDATYVNTEGRVQRARLAVQPPGEAREDWKILRAFSEGIGRRLPYDDSVALRRRLAEASPAFATAEALERRGIADATGPKGDPGGMGESPFALPITNYYQADAISRASDTMAECTRVYGGSAQAKLAAE